MFAYMRNRKDEWRRGSSRRVRGERSHHVILLVVGAVLSASPAADAQTYVSGSITTNTIWDVAGSPYILTGNVTVYDATLTINPDVAVELNDYAIVIGTSHNGYLLADSSSFTGIGDYLLRLVRGSMTLTGCTFEGMGGSYALNLETGSASVTACTVTDVEYPFLVVAGSHDLSGNDVSGCSYEAVAVSGYIGYSSAVWGSWGLPIHLVGNVLVDERYTLTVEPGVYVELGGYTITVGTGPSYPDPAYLVADGATFTGSASPLLHLVRGSMTLTGCTFEGMGGSYALNLETGSASVTACTVTDVEYPFLVVAGSHDLSGNDVSGCSYEAVAVSGYIGYSSAVWGSWGLPIHLVGNVLVDERYTLTVEPGVYVELGGYTITVGTGPSYPDPAYLVADGATFTGSASPLLHLVRGSMTLTGCTFEGMGGSYALNLETGSASVTACTVTDVEYPFLVVAGSHDLSGNDVSGCSYEAVAVSGYIGYSSAVWGSWGLPIHLVGNVLVDERYTLTVEPGVYVELGGYTITVGTGPSYPDPAYLVADGATLVGSGDCLVRLVLGSCTFVSCTFVGGNSGIIITEGSGSAYCCWFLGQSSYGLSNAGTTVADARWCYWDHPSGPSGVGSGQGVAVSENVLYEPWLLGPPVQPEYTSGDQSDSSGTSDDPVNTSTGSFFHAETDLTAPTRGGLLAFTRYYNSDAGAAARSRPVRTVSGQLCSTANPVPDRRVGHALSTEHDGESHEAGTMALVGLSITLITIPTLYFACWFFQRKVPSSTHTVANARKDRRAPECSPSARTRERARRRRRHTPLAVRRGT